MALTLPELYSKNNDVTVDYTKTLLQKFQHLIKWKRNASIMEFGYADGGASRSSLFPTIPEDFNEFVGTDISEKMVSYAKTNSKHPKMKFMVLDIAAKDLPEDLMGRFDHIFSFYAMNVVSDPAQAFANMNKMLKPGGSIFLIFVENSPVADALYRMTKHPDWEKFKQPNAKSPYLYSENLQQRWETYLKRSDFEDWTLLLEKGCHEFPDEKTFDDFFIACNTVLPHINKDLQEEYKKLYLEEAKKGNMSRISQRNGLKTIEINFNMFVISSSKP
ncbi:hypothetical protein JTB14_002730 [Gonioctena quinquepunctata]|nr:hypothetical protein JTB14_002730 [Gonioctena quinquepunctata]